MNKQSEEQHELGIDRNDGIKATDQLRPVIQGLIDRGLDIRSIMVAISNAFFGCLLEAGLSKLKAERASKKFHKKIDRHGYSREEVKIAYEAIGSEISHIQLQGISSKAVAWSLAGALINIVRGHKDINENDVENLTYGLIAQINETKENNV